MDKERLTLWAILGLYILVMIAPAYAATLKVKTQGYPNTIANKQFLHINYSGFTNKPILIVLPTITGWNSASVRMKNITTSGADLTPTEPLGFDGPHASMQSSLLLVDTGAFEITNHAGEEVMLLAGSKMVSAVQHGDDANWSDPEGWHYISFPNALFTTPPVVLASIQTMNSEGQGGPPNDTSSPFLTVAIRNVTTAGFEVALERSEVNDGDVVLAEEIGYVALSDSFGSFTGNGNTTIKYDARAALQTANGNNGTHGWRLTSPTTNNVQCSSSSTFNYRQAFTTGPIVVASKRTHNNPDGGWLRLCSSTSSAVSLVVDEDRTTDNERWLDTHEYEQVSYAAFSQDFELSPLHSAFKPEFTVTKSSQVVYDPINLSDNPKAIPWAIVQYDIHIENKGIGTTDTGAFVIGDNLPSNAELLVTGLDCGAVAFTNGSVDSGLYCGSNNVLFSADGSDFSYTPTPDANDADASVTALKIKPDGFFKGAYGGGNPNITFSYQTRIK